MVRTIIGVIFGINAVTDNKQLDILEQATAYPECIPMVTVNLIKGFFQAQSTALKLNLYQWQAINQQRNVKACFACVLFGVVLLNLTGDLKLILAPFIFINKAKPFLRTVITQQLIAIAQDSGAFDHFIAFGQMQKNTVKFAVSEWGSLQPIVNFNLLAEVGFHTGFVGDIDQFVMHTH